MSKMNWDNCKTYTSYVRSYEKKRPKKWIPATDKQKDLLLKLGGKIRLDLSKQEASDMIAYRLEKKRK